MIAPGSPHAGCWQATSPARAGSPARVAGGAGRAHPAAAGSPRSTSLARPCGPASRFEIARGSRIRPTRIPDEPVDVPEIDRTSSTRCRCPTGRRRRPSCTTPSSAGSPTPISAGSVAYDAAQDPEACRVILLRLLLDARRLREPESDGALHLDRCRGPLGDRRAAASSRGQQSNTSVMFGEVAMLKLFRRLELGRNLDIEMHARAEQGRGARRRRAVRLDRGRLGRRRPDASADLAMVVEKLADAEDGWALALDRLRDQRRIRAPRPTALGRALAETHAALRDAFPTARGSAPPPRR